MSKKLTKTLATIVGGVIGIGLATSVSAYTPPQNQEVYDFGRKNLINTVVNIPYGKIVEWDFTNDGETDWTETHATFPDGRKLVRYNWRHQYELERISVTNEDGTIENLMKRRTEGKVKNGKDIGGNLINYAYIDLLNRFRIIENTWKGDEITFQISKDRYINPESVVDFKEEDIKIHETVSEFIDGIKIIAGIQIWTRIYKPYTTIEGKYDDNRDGIIEYALIMEYLGGEGINNIYKLDINADKLIDIIRVKDSMGYVEYEWKNGRYEKVFEKLWKDFPPDHPPED